MNIPQYTMLSRRERNVLKNEIKRELINATRGSFNKDGTASSDINLNMVVKNVFDALYRHTARDPDDKNAKALYVDKWADMKNKVVEDPWADMRGPAQESDTPTNKRLVMTADGPVLIDDDNEVTFQDER